MSTGVNWQAVTSNPSSWPELKLPEERPAELGLKLLLEDLLEEDLPELKLPDDRPVELLPVLKLPLEKELPDE